MTDSPTPAKLGPATAYMIAVGVILADQAAKRYVLEGLHLETLGRVDWFGPLQLTMVWNRGVSFGLFRADADLMRWVLAAFSAIVAVLLIIWARKQSRGLTLTALGLVIGGAVGNLIDRVRFGAVVDFIDVSALYFPWVFNVADAAITIGVVLLLIDSARSDRLSRPAP